MAGTGFIGADAEQLEAFAARVDHAVQSLEAVRSTVGGNVGQVHWEGRDGDQLRQDWRGRHAATIIAACGRLRELAQALRRNASEQRGASGAAGGSLTGVGRGSVPMLGGLSAWVDQNSDLVEGGKALTWLGERLGDIHRDQVLVGAVSDLRRLADFAGPFKVGPLDALSLGADIDKLAAELSNGDLDWSTVRQTVWDAASLYPPVGLVTGAWDVGAFIGERAANILQEQFHYQDAITDSIVADRYGGSLTPAEADEFARRYASPAGPLYWAQDLVTADVHAVGNGIKSLWDKVF